MMRYRSGCPVSLWYLRATLIAQFDRLGAGIAEEHGVGEAIVDEPLRQLLLARNAEQVRGVPQALRLLGDGVDDVRMAVAEPGHRDAAGEIEKLAPVGGVEIATLAPVDGDIPPTVGRHNGWYHGNSPALWVGTAGNAATIVVVARPRQHFAAISNANRRNRDRPSSALSSPWRGRRP